MAEIAGMRVRDLYSARGSHDGCGECCSRLLPLTTSEALRMRALGRRLGIGPRPRDGDAIDMRCPFLDSSRRCAIYDERPRICRAFTCQRGAMPPATEVFGGCEGYRVHDVSEMLGGEPLGEEIEEMRTSDGLDR